MKGCRDIVEISLTLALSYLALSLTFKDKML